MRFVFGDHLADCHVCVHLEVQRPEAFHGNVLRALDIGEKIGHLHEPRVGFIGDDIVEIIHWEIEWCWIRGGSSFLLRFGSCRGQGCNNVLVRTGYDNCNI